jgi:hypothetical protein
MEALLYGEIAVHRMADGPGWCISYAPRGLRISMRYLVFATESAAMDLVEEIYPYSNNWADWFDQPVIPEVLRQKVSDAHARAEAKGAFLAHRVAPTRHAV